MNRKHFAAWSGISAEELAGLPTFYMPNLSYDKKKLAFYWDKTGRMELYVMDAEPGAEPRQVSDGQMPRDMRAGFCWMRDGSAIIYAKDHEGDEQHNLWRIDIESGEAEQLTSTPYAQEYPVEVGPDNRTLLIATDKDDQMNLYAFDLEAHTYTRLTAYASPTRGAVWSPDGSQIAYATNETADLKNQDVYVMSADGALKRRILRMKVGSEDSVTDWSADGRYLAVTSDFRGKEGAGVYDLQTDEVHWFSPEDRTQLSGKFSPDSRLLLGMESRDAAMNTIIYVVESGEQVPVELPPGMSYGADWIENNRFMVRLETDTRRAELRDYEIDKGESETLLEAEYGSIDPALFVSHEYVWYESSDGLKIPAILYRPRDVDPDKKYPALVEVHGGPTGQFFRNFDPFAQFLANRGYVVIQPNPRGSTGYGVEFRDMAIKDWGGGDLEDIAAAAEYLRGLPEVDPDRIGVWGGSYGGYMTYIAVTKKPDLWKAGVAWMGITDLHTLYEDSMEHFKYYLREQMGDPEADADLWCDRSALNFAEQMSAKLLIVHGLNDPRCPIEQARIFRDRLIELGKVEGEDFEYVELADEGHGSQGIEQKTRMYKLLAEFFDSTL